jgi:histidyl-tRNA synthetase
VLGGGRYDLLVEQLDGKSTPAIGFACGIERLMMMMDSESGGGFIYPDEERIKLYIATYGDEAKEKTIGLLQQIREKGYKCETDFLSRSIKSQMKEANKLNSEYVIVLGEDELKNNKALVKRMSDGMEADIKIDAEDIIKNLNS